MRHEDEAGQVMKGLHCLSVVNDRAPVLCVMPAPWYDPSIKGHTMKKQDFLLKLTG